MKKILILSTSKSDNKLKFVQSLSESISDIAKVELGVFEDLVFYIERGKVDVYIGGENIKKFDIVYFRRAGKISLAGSLAICFQNLGIKFFDSSFREIGPVGNKLTSLVKLAWADLPVIPTFFCFGNKLSEQKKVIIEKLGLPIVLKDLNLQRGEGVSLLNTASDFDSLSTFEEKSYLFQKFIVSNEEYRVMVLKDRIGAYERKIRTDENEFRSNVALGAEEKFFPVDQISDEMKEISIKAAKALSIEIAGTDVLIEKDNRYMWLLEVNRGPGLTYDSNLSPELEAIGKFFRSELNQKTR